MRVHIANALASFLFYAAASAAAAPPAAPPDLKSALIETRQPIRQGPGGLTGEGARTLDAAVAEARYVGIGEDHFTREIPAFAAALCRIMAPQGLSAYVVEAGPIATDAIAEMLARTDREARLAAFAKAYPNAVAFLDGREENQAAASCRASTPGGPVRLIGIDQEFLGASGLLLDTVLQAKLSAAARREVTALRGEEKRAAAEAAEEGDPGSLLMMNADPVRLGRVEALLRTGGDAKARKAFGELVASHAIYALGATSGSASNRMRSLLMKRHLVEALPATGKVLLKFGDWHFYKGVNPLGQLDIGNFISERADGEGVKSLHILVLAAGGSHGAFGGYGRQAKATAFTQSDDKDYRWFALAADNRLGEGWTLYDLRGLRHRRIGGVDADWRRAIDGYDLLIVIPEVSAAQLVGYR